MTFATPSWSQPDEVPSPHPKAWHLLTGEYPPQFGGVSDYSALVASDLSRRGLPVHIWAPPCAGVAPDVPGVTVHRDVVGHWSPSDLTLLSSALDAMPGPRRILVQYTPNAWGYKGVNLGFGRWLARRHAAGDAIWTMIHEAIYPSRLRDKPTRWLLGPLHRLMLRDLVAASDRIYISTTSMAHLLAKAGRWLPVPSNIPVVDDPQAVAAIRARLAPRGERIVGHFGTYVGHTRRPVPALVRELLDGHEGRIMLLIGRDGESMARELIATFPEFSGRVMATPTTEARGVSLHIQACDVMAQCYDDGVSGRRGTMMACLAHGRATVTNFGQHSEPVWFESGGVVGCPRYDPPGVARAADALLADPARRAAQAARAKSLYDRYFAVERSIEVLVHDAEREMVRS